MEILSIFNTNNRSVVSIKKGVVYYVGQLYNISSVNIIPPNYQYYDCVRSSDYLFNKESIEFIRTMLLRKTSKNQYHKRIYLSRRKASLRRRFNDDEIEKLMIKYGFVTMYPEDYTVIEQATMFNEAEIIVGGTGAAFANIVFCNPKCKALCLTNYDLPLSFFSTIASIVGMQLFYIFATEYDSTKKMNMQDDFIIDVTKVEQLINHWVS
jgi:capsular polysaccharide biosynthesis protein